MRDAVKETREDENVRAVILRSKIPGLFCAGADLKARLTMSKWDTERFVCTLRDTFDELYV